MMKFVNDSKVLKLGVTILVLLGLLVGVSTCRPIDYQEMSASGYPFLIQDGTGTEIFSISDAGNTDVAGTFNVDGASTLASASVTGAATLGSVSVTGATTLNGVVDAEVGTEHIGMMTVLTTDIVFDTVTGTVATIGDGEVWLVYSVFHQTTTNFDCTADCTLTVGDGGDADGFLAAADANLQAAFTEDTGFAAGFFGIENGSQGVYTLDDGGPFVYAPSGADETIDYALGGTSLAAGAGTIYVVYVRIL